MATVSARMTTYSQSGGLFRRYRIAVAITNTPAVHKRLDGAARPATKSRRPKAGSHQAYLRRVLILAGMTPNGGVSQRTATG